MDINGLITSAAKKHDVPESLLNNILKKESNKNPNTRLGPKTKSGERASGIAQITPQTAKHLGITNVNDPVQAINGAAKYLRELLTRFNGDEKLAAAAYNAGPGNVEKYGGVPPFKETQKYVEGIEGAETTDEPQLSLVGGGTMPLSRLDRQREGPPEYTSSDETDTGGGESDALSSLFASGTPNAPIQRWQIVQAVRATNPNIPKSATDKQVFNNWITKDWPNAPRGWKRHPFDGDVSQGAGTPTPTTPTAQPSKFEELMGKAKQAYGKFQEETFGAVQRGAHQLGETAAKKGVGPALKEAFSQEPQFTPESKEKAGTEGPVAQFRNWLLGSPTEKGLAQSKERREQARREVEAVPDAQRYTATKLAIGAAEGVADSMIEIGKPENLAMITAFSRLDPSGWARSTTKAGKTIARGIQAARMLASGGLSIQAARQLYADVPELMDAINKGDWEEVGRKASEDAIQGVILWKTGKEAVGGTVSKAWETAKSKTRAAKEALTPPTAGEGKTKAGVETVEKYAKQKPTEGKIPPEKIPPGRQLPEATKPETRQARMLPEAGKETPLPNDPVQQIVHGAGAEVGDDFRNHIVNMSAMSLDALTRIQTEAQAKYDRAVARVHGENAPFAEQQPGEKIPEEYVKVINKARGQLDVINKLVNLKRGQAGINLPGVGVEAKPGAARPMPAPATGAPMEPPRAAQQYTTGGATMMPPGPPPLARQPGVPPEAPIPEQGFRMSQPPTGGRPTVELPETRLLEAGTQNIPMPPAGTFEAEQAARPTPPPETRPAAKKKSAPRAKKPSARTKKAKAPAVNPPAAVEPKAPGKPEAKAGGPTPAAKPPAVTEPPPGEPTAKEFKVEQGQSYTIPQDNPELGLLKGTKVTYHGTTKNGLSITEEHPDGSRTNTVLHDTTPEELAQALTARKGKVRTGGPLPSREEMARVEAGVGTETTKTGVTPKGEGFEATNAKGETKSFKTKGAAQRFSEGRSLLDELKSKNKAFFEEATKPAEKEEGFFKSEKGTSNIGEAIRRLFGDQPDRKEAVELRAILEREDSGEITEQDEARLQEIVEKAINEKKAEAALAAGPKKEKQTRQEQYEEAMRKQIQSQKSAEASKLPETPTPPPETRPQTYSKQMEELQAKQRRVGELGSREEAELKRAQEKVIKKKGIEEPKPAAKEPMSERGRELLEERDALRAQVKAAKLAREAEEPHEMTREDEADIAKLGLEGEDLNRYKELFMKQKGSAEFASHDMTMEEARQFAEMNKPKMLGSPLTEAEAKEMREIEDRSKTKMKGPPAGPAGNNSANFALRMAKRSGSRDVTLTIHDPFSNEKVGEYRFNPQDAGPTVKEMLARQLQKAGPGATVLVGNEAFTISETPKTVERGTDISALQRKLGEKPTPIEGQDIAGLAEPKKGKTKATDINAKKVKPRVPRGEGTAVRETREGPPEPPTTGTSALDTTEGQRSVREDARIRVQNIRDRMEAFLFNPTGLTPKADLAKARASWNEANKLLREGDAKAAKEAAQKAEDEVDELNEATWINLQKFWNEEKGTSEFGRIFREKGRNFWMGASGKNIDVTRTHGHAAAEFLKKKYEDTNYKELLNEMIDKHNFVRVNDNNIELSHKQLDSSQFMNAVMQAVATAKSDGIDHINIDVHEPDGFRFITVTRNQLSEFMNDPKKFAKSHGNVSSAKDEEDFLASFKKATKGKKKPIAAPPATRAERGFAYRRVGD
jgi:hypothetical protein